MRFNYRESQTTTILARRNRVREGGTERAPPNLPNESARPRQSRALEVAGLDREPDPRVQAGDLRGERGREPLHVYGEPSEVQPDRSGLHGLTRRRRKDAIPTNGNLSDALQSQSSQIGTPVTVKR